MYYNDACCTSERTLPFCKYTSKTVTLLGKKVLKTVLIYSHEHDLIWIETKPQRTNESKLYWLDARTRKRDLLSTDHHYRPSTNTEIRLMVLYLCIYLIATRDENRENAIFFQFGLLFACILFSTWSHYGEFVSWSFQVFFSIFSVRGQIGFQASKNHTHLPPKYTSTLHVLKYMYVH